jgi:glycosyltransferase involved in cell wall biosynthesis
LPMHLPEKEVTSDKWKIGNRKMILYQGALNVGRGIEHVITAMHHLEGAVFVIAGDGDIREQLLKQVLAENVGEQVIFTGRIPLEELHNLTRHASVGLSIEQNLGLNYYFALPNKLFDYIQAGVPVLVSDLPEMRKVVMDYDIGLILHKHNTEALVEKLREMLYDEAQRKKWNANLAKAAEELCWEREEEKLLKIYLHTDQS